MKKLLLYSIIALLGATGIYGTAYKNQSLPSWFRTGNQKTQYDRSIKFDYGTPIQVAEVVDGDTIVLINGEHLRYIGIDTPEEFDPRKPVQCFAEAAAARNKELVLGKMVTIYKDVSARDAYNRLLGFVYLADGTLVNLELVREGYAFAYSYPPDISKSTDFVAAEQDARAIKRGLWADCQVHQASGGRKSTNPE